MTTPITATSALPADSRKPFSIDVLDQQRKAFQTASALIRLGYVFLADRPIQVFTHNNNVAFTMVLGTPEETGFADAQDAIALGLRKEAHEFDQRVEREVERRIEQMRIDEIEAKKAALLADHKKQMAQIEKTAAAELANLK